MIDNHDWTPRWTSGTLRRTKHRASEYVTGIAAGKNPKLLAHARPFGAECAIPRLLCACA
jgi:hypothetical protein